MAAESYPSRSSHLRKAYRELEVAKNLDVDLNTGTSAESNAVIRTKQLLCYAEATAHFSAAAIPDLPILQRTILTADSWTPGS